MARPLCPLHASHIAHNIAVGVENTDGGTAPSLSPFSWRTSRTKVSGRKIDGAS